MKMLTVADDIILQIQTPGGYAVEAFPAPIPGGSPGSAARVVWRQDGTGSAVTWADVMAQLTAPGMQIFISEASPSYTIPPGAWDVRGAVFVAPVERFAVVDIQDGAQLQNCAGAYGGVILEDGNTTAPAFSWPDAPTVAWFTIDGQQGLAGLSAAGGSPNLFDFTDSSALVLNLTNGATLANPSGFPCITLPLGTTFFAVVTESVTNTATLPGNFLAGPVASSYTLLSDGTQQISPPVNPSFSGTYAFQVFATQGGVGKTVDRPQNTAFGTLYFDTDVNEFIYWAQPGQWEPLVGSRQYPNRRNHSVNAARVENVQGSEPILTAQSGGNVAGGFNGAGVGNKAILGTTNGAEGQPLGLIALGFEWTWTDLQPEIPNFPVYANLLIDLNGDQSAWAVGVIDPTIPPSLFNGSTVLNIDGSKTTTWLVATDAILIVNGLQAPPNPPGIGFVLPTHTEAGPPPPPLPGGWLHYSWSFADILLAYPAAVFRSGDTGDNGLPKSPNVCRWFMLITGDSNNNTERRFRLQRILIDGAPF